MKLNPRQAPLYGSCVLTVQLSNDELCEREDLEFFLHFTGSTQRHVSSTLKISHDTLQLVCPAHDRCESVVVTLCSRGPDGLVHHLSSEQMCFVQDLALDMAQFLVSAVGQDEGTEGALLLNECHIPLQECEKMDQSLALAFKHLTLPPDWSVLGGNNDLAPQETLLHFAARRGLQRVASFLLQQPGARQALALPNREGATPATLAQSCGHSALLELLTQEETGTQDSTETHRRLCSGACVVQHHPDLNTYTLSAVIEPGTTPHCLISDVQDLHSVILQNTAQVELPHIAEECAADPEVCFEQSQGNSVNTTEEEFVPVCEKTNKNEHPGPPQCREDDGDRCLSAKAPESLSDNGNCDEERECSSENIDQDYGAQAESVAAGILGDSSDSLQNSSEGESAAPSCGKEQEETDRAQDLVCEARQSTEGPEREVQEEGRSLLRADEDQSLELSESAAGDMGITQSADTPESSDVGSCSQRDESRDESEVGNGDSSSLEQEEMEGINEDSAMDQSGNDEQESNKADLQSASPLISADMIHPVDDKHEINATQPSDSYELGPKEQEKTAEDNTDTQEEDTLISHNEPETENSHEQSDTMCYPDSTPKETCQKNDTVGELQMLLDAETNQCSSGFELDDTSSVTLDTISQNSTHLPEPEPETPTGEPDSTVISETTAGSESEGQTLACSTDVSLAALGSEPESSTPSSEDTLKPEETERVSANMVQRDSSSDQQEVSQQNSLTCECEHTQVSEDRENRISLENDDRTEEISLKNGDGLPETSDVDLLKNSEFPDQEDRAASPNNLVSEETVDLRTTEDRLIIIEEEVQACLDHSESVLRNFSTSSPSDIVDGSVSLDEQSRLRSEDSDKPEVVDTDSAVTKLTEAKETQEVKHEEDIDGHIKAHQEELDVSLDNQVDLHTERCPRGVNTDVDVSMIHREGHSLCLDNSTHSRPLEKRHSSASTESPRSPARHSTGSTTLRDSGSDTDGFISTDTGEDSVFRKGQEVLAVSDSASEVSVSCSSTDDTTSLCQPSSSAESSEEVRRRGAGAGGGEAEEEAKDRVTEVLLRSSLLRSSVRSQSPFRRHSWGPGKNQAGEGDMNQRSSLRSTGDQKPIYHRRSLSWCPTEIPFSSDLDEISQLLSYSLEGLAAERDDGKRWQVQGARSSQDQQSEDTGSQVSLTEEGQDSDLGDSSSLDSQKSRRYRPFRRSCKSMTLPLRESVSMLSISQRDIDAVRSCGSTSNSLAYSITEEEPGPLRGDFEGKIENKVSRTFSYLKSKMYKKSREKDKEKSREKEAREKEKKAVNGHLFSSVILGHAALCQHCNKTLNVKDTFSCTVCSVFVHKSCRDSIPACTKGKFLKQPQIVIPESTTMSGVTLRTKTSAPRERPWSAILSPDDHLSLVATPRRHTSIMPFNSSNLSKSMSISNIAAFDEMPLKNLRYLSQSTDNLHKANKVNESTESLIDEGTEIDGQLMGEFEADAKELEADSWSLTADKKYLKQLKKDVIKQQDVIYELIQTEMHHVRTLRIMADVYSKGLLKEVQLEAQTVDKVFPVLDDLLEMHTHFFSSLLERRREAKQAGKDGAFAVHRIGDILVKQFSGSNAESMKKVYGKFCSRHNEAVNMYKELHTKDKRFQTFIRKKMSSSIVRRLGIPECILLVTQRLTKYPVLLQRILQHTKDNEEEYENLTQALQLIKDVIAAVDNKVNKHEKKKKLEEIYNRTDGRTITRMKSGQMFAREDLIRGRKLLHDGPLQLKTMAGRLKDVQALLLTDVLIFLQEKDQKYVFASLDQRATVIPLQKLIVREVANEDRGFFIIAAGIEQPEMVEVHATSRDERNTWMQLIQSAMQSREKDDDEGIPSETEEDKKLLESKAKEMRAMLQRKDDQILALLNEKIKLFHDMCGSGSREDTASAIRMLFRACNDDMPKGENIMKEAIREVEMLQTLVHSGLGGAVSQQGATDPGNTASVLLPRRSETFGGFDSHQMNSSKHGDKEEVEDLRRTESDSVLKKGGNTNLLLVLKRNREQVLSSVTHLHALLSSLQALVVQQDTFLEEQRQAVSERPSSRPSSRPPSLVEQEKQRSAERQRQEAAAHAEERKRREKEWEARDKELSNREQLLNAKEEEAQRRRFQLEDAQQELQSKKEDYQKDLERLRDAQRRLEREKEQMKREMEMLEQLRETEKRVSRTLSSTSEDSLNIQSSSSVEQETKQEKDEGEQSTSPGKNSLSRIDSRQKGRNLNAFNPFAPKVMSAEGQKQIPNRLLQLARPKEKKDKKKKKSKSKPTQEAESHLLPLTDPPLDGEIFC